MSQEANRRSFERAVERLSGCPRDRLFGRIVDVVRYAQRSGCGYYSSSAIERMLYGMAVRADLVADAPAVTAEPGSLLIVMSEAYAVGGHTRVVERWIELDDAHRYSLVLTRQGTAPLPARLVSAVARSGGEIRLLDAAKDVLARAADLRAYAGRFDKTILHIHTDDVIPLLAFGTEKFTRPVGFYNHADHLFWLGVGLADCVAELRRSKINVTRWIRGAARSVFVGIPMDAKCPTEPDRAAAKRALGLAPDVPVIVTCGSATKYDPALGMDFLSVARRILEANDRAVLIGIGMTFRDLPAWKWANAELGGRIRAEGPVPFERLYGYYDAADVYLDSYPIGGGTALPDALCRGCPVLSLPSPDGKMDWIYDSGGYYEREEDLIAQTGRILRGEIDGTAFARSEYEIFRTVNDPAAFRERLQAFLAELTGPHRVRPFESGFDGFTDLDRYHLEENSRREYLFGGESSWLACYYRYSPLGRDKVIRCRPFELVVKRRRLSL